MDPVYRKTQDLIYATLSSRALLVTESAFVWLMIVTPSDCFMFVLTYLCTYLVHY